MSKRPSLFIQPTPAPAADPRKALVQEEAAEAPRRHVVARTREGKRNATAYLEPEAFRQLRMLMVREDTTIQALLIEGINEVFAKRGLSRIA